MSFHLDDYWYIIEPIRQRLAGARTGPTGEDDLRVAAAGDIEALLKVLDSLCETFGEDESPIVALQHRRRCPRRGIVRRNRRRLAEERLSRMRSALHEARTQRDEASARLAKMALQNESIK